MFADFPPGERFSESNKVNLKTLFGPICILSLALFASNASAAPLDKSANAKIDEAINVHYLSTNFEKAEGLLKGTLKACGNRCSASVKARAWMYIGIVRGAGNQDLDGAAAAFAEALTLDPNQELDRDLATDELRELYAETTGGEVADPGGGEVILEETGGGGPTEVPTGGMLCTPEVVEVETRRPIPVSCTTDRPATRATLYYKEFGAPSWSQVNMGKGGDSWLGTIPCSATGNQGNLSWYVKAMGSKGETIDNLGSENAPIQVATVPSTAAPPPAYPGEEAPERCMDPADCPEEMRGTPACPGTTKGGGGGSGGWGDACRSSRDCQSDLACMDGTCESPPSCEVDEDCSGGTCVDFLCRYEDGDWGDGDGGAAGDQPVNFVGLHFGIDLAQISGDAVCNPAAGSDFTCYAGEEVYAVPAVSMTHDPMSPTYDPTQSGRIGSSLAPSTIRVLASYERFFTDKIAVEGRLGAAFGGAPDSGFADLLHIGVRGKYWFSGMGPGLRLFGLLGAGMGQVDAKKELAVREFAADNSEAYRQYCGGQPYCRVSPITAYKKLGTTFVTAGIGAFLNLGDHGPVVELNGRVMLPASGFVVQPTLGWMLGF